MMTNKESFLESRHTKASWRSEYSAISDGPCVQFCPNRLPGVRGRQAVPVSSCVWRRPWLCSTEPASWPRLVRLMGHRGSRTGDLRLASKHPGSRPLPSASAPLRASTRSRRAVWLSSVHGNGCSMQECG